MIIVFSIVRKLVQPGRLKALEILIRAAEPHAGQQSGAARYHFTIETQAGVKRHEISVCGLHYFCPFAGFWQVVALG